MTNAVFNVKMTRNLIRHWREERSKAVKAEDEKATLIASCYVDAFQTMLVNHGFPTLSPTDDTVEEKLPSNTYVHRELREIEASLHNRIREWRKTLRKVEHEDASWPIEQAKLYIEHYQNELLCYDLPMLPEEETPE